MFMLLVPNKDRLQLWVDALNSGDYPQTQGILKDDYGFCCLGVGCEVAKANGVPVETGETTASGYRSYTYDGRWDALPPSVAHWFGLQSNPVLLFDDSEGGHGTVVATELNDNRGLTFTEIGYAITDRYLS